MGSTFSTVHINNRQQVDSEQLIKSLYRYLAKKGLTPATKEDAQLSYYLVFSGESNWVTLSSPQYEFGADCVQSDAAGLSKALKTCCIETSVYDSDFLSVGLYNHASKHRDTVMAGRAEDASVLQAKGKRECWEPLLAKGKTWEHLTEIWNGDYIFIEEALTLMAPLLGMDAKNIAADYRYWEEVEQDNSLVHILYFKTAEPLFLKDGATKLELGASSILVSGEERYVAFCNIGGISKGLSVIILGDCFRSGEVEIGEIKIKRYKNPRINVNDPSQEFEYFTATPKECKVSDGRCGYIAEFDDYVFFEGVNKAHPSMKGRKGGDIVFVHESDIFFTATILSGDKHDFDFFVIPQENWAEGQAGRNIPVYKTREQMTKDLFPQIPCNE